MTIAFSGYQVLAQIYESTNSYVYRGIRSQDKQPVILKVLKQDYPTPAELTRYKQEYEITRRLNSDGIVKAIDLQKYQNTLVMILEDFGGESLQELLRERRLTLSEFLSLAIRITSSLGDLHAANVIHKDINPSNIVFNPATEQLKIIDFGIATILTRENPALKNPNVLEGTLAYMSPEQTGRMNRSLDYRSDFYGLGATFYELLTYQLPFDATDAMSLVHCHIAKQPVPPHQINGEIPRSVSDMVMKLLGKTAEERYQSAWGIKADLELCLAQLQGEGKISEFTLGSQDISDKFQIPQKLYGREIEIETYLAAFERVISHQVEIMLVAGYSGIGKSALVQELYKPLTQKRGYFISGKFDQFQRNIPYSAVVAAFKGLVRQLLTESEAQLNLWRSKLEAAFGPNGQVIIDVIPEVELIVSPQPAVQELGPTEAQNRFNRVFQKFIGVFCQRSHPLVIFLDDLQWADSATLKLIELIMTDTDTNHLFMIGAYRDNEVSPTHPLMMTLEKLRSQGVSINQITLTPLSKEDITQLIADTLHSDNERVIPLAELVVRKTEGNPFFMNEFLLTLYQENLLTFNIQLRSWQWDIAEIEAVGITDNVVDLMIGKLQKLPSPTQQVLCFAACVGNQFDLNTLEIVQSKSAGEIFSELLPAIQLGLIQPISELETTDLLEAPLLIVNYKFRHDRVQQAAEALIDSEDKKAVHLQIGRLLLENLSDSERSERIFEIVDHLNQSIELIKEPLSGIELAALNLSAGKKAKDATAYKAAREYLAIARKMLPENSWKQDYSLSFEMYIESADVEYLNGNYQEAELGLVQMLERAASNLDKAVIYKMMILQYTMRSQYAEAIQAGRNGLQLLGVELPVDNYPEAIDRVVERVKENLQGRSIASLVNLPECQIAEKKEIMQILANLGAVVFFTNIDFYVIVVGTSIIHSMTYGNVDESAHDYGGWGLILGSYLGDYPGSYEFGLLGMRLSEKLNNLVQKCQAYNLFVVHIAPWRKPVRNIAPLYDECVKAGLESGELAYVGYTYSWSLANWFYQGISLEEFYSKIATSLRFAQKTQNQLAIDISSSYPLIVANLRGLTPGKLELDTAEMSEESFMAACRQNGNLSAVCTYLTHRAQLLYLYGEYGAAGQSIEEAKELINYVTSIITTVEIFFYHSLIIAAVAPQIDLKEPKDYGQLLSANQKQMQIWAENCPENFQHKYLLVAAEMARISGQELEAMDLYDRAIASARENEFVHNVALANELAAKFWYAKGKEEIAQLYMQKAHYGYQLWGAFRKVEDLQQKYPQLLGKTPDASHARGFGASGTTTTTTTGTGKTEALDLTTVMKASQALASEIQLDKLLGKLMKIVMENAGAQKSFLILRSQDAAGGETRTLRIEASGVGDEVTVLQSIPIERSPSVSPNIINYVSRTRAAVVLNDATKEGNFTLDPYIKEHQPKSILCTPLLNQGQLAGILYLENNLTTGAFTPDRLEVLQLLSSQAAISIENANLYRSLEVKVEERTAALAAATEEAQAANKAKSSFIANMSHELRSPLNAILGFSQLMIRSSGLSQEHTENLGIINRSGEHLLTLINNVLDLSKIESGKITLNEKNFDLYRLLSDIEDMFHLKAVEKGLYLEISRSDDLPRYIRTDEVKLRQVLINLLNNALKFTHSGGVSVRARLLNDPDNEQLAIHFEVSDTGAGIAPEEIDSLFEAFVQTSTGKQAQEGTGLGLPISRQFVQLMGGDIFVSSQVGRGTVFYFDIFVSLVEEVEIQTNFPTRKVIALEPNQRQYRILIVDDKPINRQLLIKLLNPLGFELKEATNGLQAVEIFSRWSPDLIWMDMRMPVMDGYEATRLLKATPKGQTTPIIALTANVLEEEKASVMSAGCDDFLSKPFRETDIFDMMSFHIGVRYVYEPEQKTTERPKGPEQSEVLTAAAIKALPGEWVASLSQALEQGDLDELASLVSDISTQNAPLGSALKACLDKFEFDKVLSLIPE